MHALRVKALASTRARPSKIPAEEASRPNVQREHLLTVHALDVRWRHIIPGIGKTSAAPCCSI